MFQFSTVSVMSTVLYACISSTIDAVKLINWQLLNKMHHHISEDYNFHINLCKELKSQSLINWFLS